MIYATMRNMDKKQRLLESVRGLHQDTLEILQMDVTDQKSILDAKTKVTEGKIDILGVGLMGPLECQSLETIRGILDVNLLGTLRTIQTFLPDMKRKRQGLPFNDVYCASKFAVEGACESLAILLQHFNIHVSLIECGPVNTDFLMNLKKTEPGEEALEVDEQTISLYHQYQEHCKAVFQNAAQDIDDIIQVYLEAIEAQSPYLRYYTNRALLPMSSLKLSSMDGSQYIRAMSKLIFTSANMGPQK
ncbi:hypothetical protein DNTS_035266 [Danionella cerebrum]|uniref:Uncharacterized protein n=1 Tax=Danionella cerebrum TaxID=2873325 RepID=A0A553N335_9TELE|nr:hypothetical protein DNTS_035266 [Danionella translucida]